MQVRTFRGPNSQTVFALVKAELGDEAVILSNKTVTENGKKICEIMAAVDAADPAPAKASAKASAKAAAQPASPAPAKAPGQTARTNTCDDIIEQAFRASQDFGGEWRMFKDHILALLRPQMDLDALAPRQRLALEYLEREGVEPSVLLSVYRELRQDAARPVLPILERIAPAAPFESKNRRQKIQAFAGPHGSGKTSCLIRLALAEKRENPKARICLACCDAGQGKGRLVLKHYAELSGLAFREAACAEDFASLVSESAAFDRIYLDLPGLSREADLGGFLARLGANGSTDMAVHLILSPHFSRAQLTAFAARYATDKVQSIIWTKLDEACTFGALINMAHATGLPASALSYGSGVKNSLVPATSEAMLKLIFKHQLPGRTAADN